jgi:hypothetical protein
MWVRPDWPDWLAVDMSFSSVDDTLVDYLTHGTNPENKEIPKRIVLSAIFEAIGSPLRKVALYR